MPLTPVSFAAITNADNFDRLHTDFANDHAPVANPEAILRRIETMQMFVTVQTPEKKRWTCSATYGKLILGTADQ